VLNKVDRLPMGSPDPATLPEFSGAVKISAAKSTGINELVAVIKNELFERFTPISVTIPYSNGQLISLFHEFGKIDKIINNVGSGTISGSIPGRLMADFERFTQKQKSRVAT